jgi:hypothetical protein
MRGGFLVLVLVLVAAPVSRAQTATATPAPPPAAALNPATLPELNRLLVSATAAIRAEDVPALVALDTILERHTENGRFGPDMTMRIHEGIQALEADARRAPVLEALDGFPLIDALPPELSGLSVQIAASAKDPAEGIEPLACRVGFERDATGRWRLAAISAPRGTDDQFDIGTFTLGSEPRKPDAFARREATDLRDVVRREEATAPRLGALSLLVPSIRGLWPGTRSVRLTLRATDGTTARVRFSRTPDGRWSYDAT